MVNSISDYASNEEDTVRKTIEREKANLLPREVERQILHLWNQQLFEKGIITEDLYTKARTTINKIP